MLSCREAFSGAMSLRSDHHTNNVENVSFLGIWARLLAAALVTVVGAPATAQGQVRPGIDVWESRGFAPLAGKRIGLVTNVTGRTADGRSTVDVLAASDAIALVALFTPEHSFFADREGDVESGTHAATGIPQYSLYGDTRRPTPEMLRNLDALVFDIQDIGTRIYTYASTLAYCMEEAAAAGLPFVVLDRPNPIGGTRVAGPVLDETELSFVGYAPIPMRHGMTIGELARYFNSERGIGADLQVVEVAGWQRGMWFDETGLQWINPSPNIRNPKQALVYPALGPLEWTSISVGRGTDEPFEWFGAPWIDGRALAAALNEAAPPGVRAVPRSLTPASSVHADTRCGGVYLEIIDRNAFDSGLLLATIAATLERLYPMDWERARLLPLWGDTAIGTQLNADLPGPAIVASWQPALDAFRVVRARYLLYE
jgi:uncharacterized protein YbbC (DUF1343 family)